jgi:hypothetical protein
MNLNELETCFRNKQKLLSNLADDKEFDLIFSLIERNKRLIEENDKLATLNRHYYHHFYNGNIDKMVQDFKYLME